MISQRRRVTAWARMGRLLAFVAALALVIGLHPPHAGAAGAPADHGHASNHSHFSAACVKAAVEQPFQPGTGAAGHADCHQLFHPLLRVVPQGTPAFSATPVTLPLAERGRHLVFTSDPPPPRATA